MDYKFVYTHSAIKDLQKLEKPLYKRLKNKLNFFLDSKNPIDFAKKLTNIKDYYRFRIGDYRIIFRVDQKTQKLVILVVVKITHRKNAY